MLYHYTIYPLESLLETIFVILIGLSSSHVGAIVLLAIVVQLSLKPLVGFVNRSGARQLEIESFIKQHLVLVCNEDDGITMMKTTIKPKILLEMPKIWQKTQLTNYNPEIEIIV